MSVAKYLKFYRDNGFFNGSIIKVRINDISFFGSELILSKDNEIIRTRTITEEVEEFFTDESGTLTLSADNGEATLSGTVTIGAYGTYNITLSGAVSDRSRDIFASKQSITFDENHTSDTVEIAYTGDAANLSVTSLNTNVAEVSINNNIITVNAADSGYKGTSNVVVSVAQTQEYDKGNLTILVTKTNGEVDKTWQGLKSIVQEEKETELCAVGEEHSLTLSNGQTVTYIVGAINNDVDHQLIMVPKAALSTGRSWHGTNANITWTNANLRTWLNDSFYAMLPSEIRDIISPRFIQVASLDGISLIDFEDLIWLPREYEILGRCLRSAGIEGTAYRINRFPCYSSIITTFGGSIWTCSRGSVSYGTYLSTYTTGTNDASAMNMVASSGVYPCFHIIKT